MARSLCPRARSKWITGEDARRHVHGERAHNDMILVGRGTYLADQPRLDVRLPVSRTIPRRALLDSRRRCRRLGNADEIRKMSIAFMTSTTSSSRAARRLRRPSSAEDLVDRILIYQAPSSSAKGGASFGYVGLDAIADAHGRWRFVGERRLGSTGSKFERRAGKLGRGHVHGHRHRHRHRPHR